MPRGSKGQKPTLRSALKQAEPAVLPDGAVPGGARPSPDPPLCKAGLHPCQIAPVAAEGSEGKAGGFEKQPASAVGTRHRLRQAGRLRQGCQEGGHWQSWRCDIWSRDSPLGQRCLVATDGWLVPRANSHLVASSRCTERAQGQPCILVPLQDLSPPLLASDSHLPDSQSHRPLLQSWRQSYRPGGPGTPRPSRGATAKPVGAVSPSMSPRHRPPSPARSQVVISRADSPRSTRRVFTSLGKLNSRGRERGRKKMVTVNV